MARPPGIPDPRDPASPLRLADPAEDHARSVVSLGDLSRGQPTSRVGEDLPAEAIDFEAIVARIGPERFAALLARVAEILAELRARRTLSGGD